MRLFVLLLVLCAARGQQVEIEFGVEDFAVDNVTGVLIDDRGWLLNEDPPDAFRVTAAQCPPGYYCTGSDNDPLACPPGTYQPHWMATTYDACIACPLDEITTICPRAGLAQPVNCLSDTVASEFVNICALLACPTGSYYTTSNSFLECRRCLPGHYCVNSTAHSCPLGTYREGEGATELGQCLPCPLGTYAVGGQIARSTVCPPCPVHHVCASPSPSAVQTCPIHTAAPEGSTSMLNCTCLPGYQCQYTKQVQFRVALNSTLESIQTIQNSPSLIAQLMQQIAASCHVDPSRVKFVGISIIT